VGYFLPAMATVGRHLFTAMAAVGGYLLESMATVTDTFLQQWQQLEDTYLQRWQELEDTYFSDGNSWGILTFSQCSGSGSTGSTCFWASQIWIH
jgi:hypothetical protein